ncbi:unnamed protein product [Periconia digitata]|uniref:Uncharacterized protein n=1 Tax=Periconia digitata TaxID=1303443 RepID=A0A9W4UQZ7_9PLEO|nr:unnamed protein product [Periconia digitata]
MPDTLSSRKSEKPSLKVVTHMHLHLPRGLVFIRRLWSVVVVDSLLVGIYISFFSPLSISLSYPDIHIHLVHPFIHASCRVWLSSSRINDVIPLTQCTCIHKPNAKYAKKQQGRNQNKIILRKVDAQQQRTASCWVPTKLRMGVCNRSCE